MSKKTAKILGLIESCRGHGLDAHYLAFFKCFNEGLYYEAHDVLEALWLADKTSPNHFFYKGLIQLAGAFVHLQKNRLRPSAALFKLAQANFLKYPATHEHLDLAVTLKLVADWLRELERFDFTQNPLTPTTAPTLNLMSDWQTKGAKPRILIATRNQHKAQEIGAMLQDRFQMLTLNDFPGAPAVVESADSFAGNAAKKATELATWLAGEVATKAKPHFVLADDSGLEVDALDGAPGVYSARFAALDSQREENSSDAENNAKLLRLLEGIPSERRTARFRCAIALVPVQETGDGVDAATVQVFEGACEGRLGNELTGAGGFGYDPLFYPEGHHQTFAELSGAIKNQISHRARALAKLGEYFSATVAP